MSLLYMTTKDHKQERIVYFGGARQFLHRVKNVFKNVYFPLKTLNPPIPFWGLEMAIIGVSTLFIDYGKIVIRDNFRVNIIRTAYNQVIFRSYSESDLHLLMFLWDFL